MQAPNVSKEETVPAGMPQPLRILYGDLYMVKLKFCNIRQSGHEFI